jgi:hypothetical protein
VHKGVEVEGGIESVGEDVEEVDLEGLDSNFWVGGVGVEELGRGGAVVTLEGVFWRFRLRWWSRRSCAARFVGRLHQKSR